MDEQYVEVIQELRCVKCGHRWLPRSHKLPDVCPSCKSRKWNESLWKPEEVENEVGKQPTTEK